MGQDRRNIRGIVQEQAFRAVWAGFIACTVTGTAAFFYHPALDAFWMAIWLTAIVPPSVVAASWIFTPKT